MITIDKNLCVGCGACIQDCPAKVIRLNEEKKAESRLDCLNCGHCVAVCPVGAAALPEYDMDEVEEYNADTFHVSPEHFLHAVKFRRSIRNFTAQPLSREILTDILNAGRYTATAKNLQDSRFVLVQEQLTEFKELFWNEFPAILEKMEQGAPRYAKIFRLFYQQHLRDASADSLFFNCTAFLVIGSERQLDAGLAAANIENMTVAHGAGALYSGYLQRLIGFSPALRSWLGLEEVPVACCMLLGYPAVTYHRTAPHKKADFTWK